jgi:amidase
MTELWAKTAAEIAEGVRGGAFSAREAAEAALARMEAVNPAINAVVDPLPETALTEADAVDAARAEGAALGPLAGVPVTVKVNVDCRGRATTNGLKLQRDHVAAEDNPVVANLRKAGAVIIGRTNTPAFSLRWFTRNGLHGETKNPRDPALTPGGSSGGASAATAAGIGAIGHGTDIAGSIRYPAYACGIHGLRPGLGRVPAVNLSLPDRHIGAQLMAVSGPLARSIDDLRLGLAAMAAEDPRDSWTAPVPLELPKPPRRVAFCPAPDGMDPAPEVLAALEDAAARLRDAGWTVEEAGCPPLREAVRLQLTLWLAEFRRTGATMLDAEGDPDARFVYDQLAARAPAPDLDGLMDTLQARARLVREWRVFFDSWPALLLPVSGAAPFPNHADVASAESFAAVVEAQTPQIAPPLMGLPGLSVATSGTDAPPIGVQLLAAPYREDILLDAGAAIADRGPRIAPVDPRL